MDAFAAGTLAPEREGICDAEDYLMLRLRLRDGLDLEQYAARFGGALNPRQRAFAEQCAAAGYAEFDGRVLRLTPRGLLVQNSIVSELMAEEE